MFLHKTFIDRLKFYSFLAFICIFFASCASLQEFFLPKPPSESKKAQEQIKPQFKILYIKTPMISYHDYAIIKDDTKDSIVTVELFRLGRNIGSIKVGKSQICFLNDCAPKWPSAKNFFGKVSYGDLFDDILLSKDIFGGIGKQILPDGGIIQRFQKSGEIIFYERKPGHTLYRNMSTGIIVSIDDYNDPSNPSD